MMGTAAVSDAFADTANLLAENGLRVVPMAEAPSADFVVFSSVADYPGIVPEDLAGDSGTVVIDGGTRGPQEILVLVLNKMGQRD